MAKKHKKINIEESMQNLEFLVEKMESGKGTLEENLNWFEEGISLVKDCQKELKSAQQKVYSLIKNSKDEFELKERK
tara:strand:- start:29 stop:259 length:231 start_codon:yes stop_codon:yes gene_type:complete